MDKDLKMNILKAILGCLLIACVLGGYFYFNHNKELDKDKKEEKTDAVLFKEEYEEYNGVKNSSNNKEYPKVDISENNPIKYSNASEIIKVLEEGTGVIYFGYPKCPWCRNAVPVLLNAAENAGIDTIYYMNLYDERDSYVLDDDNKPVLDKKGTEDYQKLLKALDKELDDYVLETDKGKEVKVGEKRIYVPAVFFVREGEIVGTHMDTVKSQTNPYKVLDEEQTEELYGIYTKYMHKVLDDLCDERC